MLVPSCPAKKIAYAYAGAVEAEMIWIEKSYASRAYPYSAI